MENQENNLVSREEEVEEEEVALQGRKSKQVSHNNNDNNNDAVSPVVVSNNGNDNENGNGHGSPISRSTSSTISSDVDQSTIANECTQKDGQVVDGINNSVYFDPEQGAESINGVSDITVSGISSPIYETKHIKVGILAENSESQNIVTKEINHQFGEILDKEGVFGSTLTTLEESISKQSIKSEPSNHAATLLEDCDTIEEIDEEGTDFDVENVLDKQNTHDLYCPNCHSCITRKVILHRRRRKIRTARRKPKQDKSEATIHLEKKAHSTDSADGHCHDTDNICSDGVPAAPPDDNNHDRDPEVFRCLACFSFFIPTGDGFKLFRASGDKTRNENVQDSKKIPASSTNWFFPFFATDKRKTTIEQGNAAKFNSEEQGSNHISSSASKNVLSQRGSDNSQVLQSDRVRVNTGQAAEDTPVKHYQGLVNDIGSAADKAGKAIVSTSTEELKSFEGALTDTREKPEDATEKDKTDAMVQQYGNGYSVKPFAATQVNSGLAENALFRPQQGGVENAGKDVIVTIEKEPLENAAPQRVPTVDGSVEDSRLPVTGIRSDVSPAEQRGARINEARGWEILKSIVYGGLIESITSLGVVSSAAAAGASTLNVLALGVANLVGGLFIIGHNLADLKNDHHGGNSSQPNEQEDTYRKTLGRRENFLLHATIAILSFVIFGLLPPVIYGFSFRKTDNKDLKLAAVGGASLICIILLAIGKAHVQRQPKKYITTLLYYVSIGVMVSGASYVAGDLFDKLLEKLGLFDQNSAVTLSFPTSKPTDLAAWASY